MTNKQHIEKPVAPLKNSTPIKLATKSYSPPQLTLFGEVKNLTLGTSPGGVDSLGETLP